MSIYDNMLKYSIKKNFLKYVKNEFKKFNQD